MPKTKLQNREKQFDKLGALIVGTAAVKDVDTDTLAKVLGVSRNTLLKYRKDIGSVSLDNVMRLCKYLSIPVDEVRAAIRY